MSKKTIVTCDVCGREESTRPSLKVEVTGATETDKYAFDVCFGCRSKIVSRIACGAWIKYLKQD